MSYKGVYRSDAPEEVLQLGGADPEMLARAARRAEPWAYTALNLNVGCPSIYGERLSVDPLHIVI